MNLQVIKNKLLLWLRKLVLYGLYFGLLFLVIAFALFQVPAVQERLLAYYTSQFSAVSGFEVTTRSFYLTWYDQLEVEGLLVKDPARNNMIAARKVGINFNISSLLKGGNINIDGARLDSAHVNLITIPESDTSSDLNINLFVARINAMSRGQGGGSGPKINIGEILLENSGFSYVNTHADTLARGFDYHHFALTIPDAELEDFKIIGDTTQFEVRSLAATDVKTGFGIKELKTGFRLSQQAMEFVRLDLKAGSSVISDTVIFSFQKQNDFNDFVSRVKIKARLRNTVIHPQDLALFAPAAAALKRPVSLQGSIDGRVNRFSFRNMNIGIGETVLKGNLDMDGLPAINETFINLKLKQSTLTLGDVTFLMPQRISSRLIQLRQLTMNCTFTGFYNDFVANGDFDGPIGRIISDINLKVNSAEVAKSTYEGRIQLRNFDLGAYLSDTIRFQKVSLSGRIAGRGLTGETADFYMDGKIDSLGILGYTYSNISTNAYFARNFYDGTLAVADPNLKLTAKGSIDFRKGKEAIQVKATLDTARLQELKLAGRHLSIQSYINIDSRGLKLDSISGTAAFKNTTIAYQNQSLHLDSMHLISRIEDKNRLIRFRSSIADFSVEGNYSYLVLFADFQRLFHEFYLNLRNNKEELSRYYAHKEGVTSEYQAKFTLELHNLKPVLQLTRLDLDISNDTRIEGRFAKGYTTIFNAFAQIDSVVYGGSIFTANEIELTGSKISDSTQILGMLSINSANQVITKGLSTRNLLAEAIWNKNQIQLGLDFDQVGLDNRMRLKSQVDFLNDTIKVSILPSLISILNEEWAVSEKNYAIIAGREIDISNLELHHENESILVNGRISSDPDQELALSVKELSLDILNSISREKFNGTMDAEMQLRNVYANPSLQNKIQIHGFSINDFLIGDITGDNDWNADKERFDINFFIDRLGQRTLDLTGYYTPGEKESPLNVEASFEKLNFKILEPLVRDNFTQLDGTLTGRYHVGGTVTRPEISGRGNIENGRLMVNYLKTLYTFKGVLRMSPREIIFDDIELRDALNNVGKLEGYIAHRNFAKFILNIDASFRNLQVMNTTLKDNNLFYGQAYGTGNLNILGPATNLKFSATAKTEKNTRLFIPVNGILSADDKDFVSFVNFTDTAVVKKLQPRKKKENTGITLDLNLDITPDAYGEIIFDIKAGDIIRGRGRGDIKLQLDTKGEFNMFGSMEFTEGAYNFTLYDIINKEFSIKPGSRITWFGDPYEGILNITAIYRQLASLAPILTDQTLAGSPQIKRKYPAEVLLKLEGPMLSPNINFDIGANDLPENVIVEGKPPVNLKFEFNAFKAKLDEQELKRQVFSLIILKKFSPPDAFSTSGTISNSVSELLSNQLSYWLNQVDQNLEVDFDLGTFDTDAFNTFQFRLSYSFLNGRLRVTGDGTYSNQAKQSDLSSIVGDWTVDYLLTPDGKFKVKMYSRSNYNQVTNSLGNQASMTTGVSLQYTQTFSQLKEIWARRRKEAEQQAEKADGTQ